jgi:phosphate transport system protein
MNSKPHLLSTFETALNKVQHDLREMAALTEASFRHAQAGLLEGDIELTNSAIADDDEIDQLEVAVGRDGTEVLMRYQPVAGDLRQIVAAMRLCSDIERVADQAEKIARKTRKIDLAHIRPYREKLLEMFNEASSLFADSLKAYQANDLDLARSIAPRDKHLDDLNAEITELATQQIAKSPNDVADHLAIILIARHIERVGDHAKNIAENAIYAASDQDIRHSHGAKGDAEQ